MAKNDTPISMSVHADPKTGKVTIVFNRKLDNVSMPAAEAVKVGEGMAKAGRDMLALAQAGVPS